MSLEVPLWQVLKNSWMVSPTSGMVFLGSLLDTTDPDQKRFAELNLITHLHWRFLRSTLSADALAFIGSQVRQHVTSPHRVMLLALLGDVELLSAKMRNRLPLSSYAECLGVSRRPEALPCLMQIAEDPSAGESARRNALRHLVVRRHLEFVDDLVVLSRPDDLRTRIALTWAGDGAERRELLGYAKALEDDGKRHSLKGALNSLTAVDFLGSDDWLQRTVELLESAPELA